MKVIDVGMYDGSDTAYYLECGHQVLAIEANPSLCAGISEKLKRYVQSGQLRVMNVAVANDAPEVQLSISGQDLGASSIFAEKVANRLPLATYRVKACPFADILAEHGPTDFIKIDIEGADRDCVMALTSKNAPRYLSFEASADIAQQLQHLSVIGYRQFKFIQQMNFRSLDRQSMLRDRLIRGAFRLAGLRDAQYIRRSGHFFKVMHSAGPPPWQSDGRWLDLTRALKQWATYPHWSWYDVHAVRD
ncbi:MAG TPA: FkbM family methyltransferase [Steroidobacteraceae bacterium]|nr:FkbM family methyltransferase [Steroidobacteraceae bacterium]